MKKRLFTMMVLLASLLVPSVLFAAGTVSQRLDGIGNDMWKLTFTCTGDSSNGSIPNTAISADIMSYLEGKYLYTISAYPTPGGVAPDAADVFILDANGEDLLGSTDGGTTANKGANLIHATLKKTTMPYSHYLSSFYFPAVTKTLILKVANQATNSANYIIELVFAR